MLIIDDREADRYLMRRALESEFEVVEATSFGDATVLLDGGKLVPALFILDLCLPDHPGEALVELIRGSDNHGNTPIIVVSSLPEVQSVAPRVNRVLRKPFHTGVLRDFALEAVRDRAGSSPQS